jgi:hypothetical protein
MQCTGYNSALGLGALNNITQGAGNVALGAFAGGTGNINNLNIPAGSSVFSSNTLVGYYSGNLLTTGSSNTFVGAAAGANETTGGSDIVIGAGQKVATPGNGHYLNIGNTIFGTGINSTTSGNIGIGTTNPTSTLYVNGSIYATSKTSGFSFTKEMVVGPKGFRVGDVVEYTGEIAKEIAIGGAYASIGKIAKNSTKENRNAWVIVSVNPESNPNSGAGKDEITYGILLSGTAKCGRLKGKGKKGDYLASSSDGLLQVDNNAPRGSIIGQLISDVPDENEEKLRDIMGVRL